MSCPCLLCLDGSPVSGDKRAEHDQTWDVSLCGSCCAEPAFCLCTVLPVSAPCAVYFLRKEALGGDDLTRYQCCQGYFNCCCFEGGMCCEAAFPSLCLAVESSLCCCCATQATRLYVMDSLKLQPDPWDNRLVRFQNCLQCVGCLTWVVGCVLDVNAVKKVGNSIGLCADCLFLSMLGCMAAQTKHELWKRGGHGAPKAPNTSVMIRP